ncbi:beta-ketoacyl synthase N-terminal-like domain-containing protein [Kitasatospora kifunensis]|uniref:Acyl transferase domain-containing protein n=1 Tax=Kitasatospora kifunensis TaxID=58351 RepID=A0A7W7QXC1_KITKI|nr:beta-ketoacyl synthase N-terminal-like domain-containing protein [Kitasatospora kifunensis]MBB4921550.1 acyl transferase domain-containing protein [Kitasatospora kifunensis]
MTGEHYDSDDYSSDGYGSDDYGSDDYGSDDYAAENDTHIAIVGMACRFPGAATPEEYWANLTAGVDSVRAFSAEELRAWGHDPAALDDPRYVPMHGIVDGIGEFDADFFQFSSRDATLLNPQHQMFLECAWEALERAGYDPRATPGTVGVYAGTGRNGYAALTQAQAERFPGVDALTLTISNEPEHLATRISYKLGLTGPSMAVLTACSSSLVAVHEAGRALLAGDCDMALAGGITLRLPRSGYRYLEGGTMSPDGRCRTFSAGAKGIVGGDGAGVVVLRRLQDALDDGDHVHAVIRGSAVNNDGHERAGFTAPGVHGQTEVIRLAHAAAEVSAASISYVEAHGTGTPVGDPIEVSALTQAFRAEQEVPAGSVLLGSVKTNIGHTDTAAGVAGLIKTALALEHRAIPATLHFEGPNPVIDFAKTPFTVNTEHRAWDSAGQPRRAGVSSFGIGGTNAHVVLEEAPRAAERAEREECAQLLVLSARTPAALAAMAERLARHLERHPELPLADVAWTLQSGRRAFAHRSYVVCADHAQAIAALSAASAAPVSKAPGAVTSEELLDRLTPELTATERAALLGELGRLWQDGSPVDWSRLHEAALPRRVPLPSYPFERRHHLVQPEPFAAPVTQAPIAAAATAAPAAAAGPAEHLAEGADDSASIEERLAVLFAKVLGEAEDLAERDFFELGGDSLTAVQLFSLVEDDFGVAPPLEAIFDAPTVTEFAVVIQELLATLRATEAADDTRGTS